jgi:magnesium-protoporphyrin O-methyltransferase
LAQGRLGVVTYEAVGSVRTWYFSGGPGQPLGLALPSAHTGAPSIRVLCGLSAQTGTSLLCTFAPKTPTLALMHTVGRLFPRGNRAPAIEPVAEQTLQQLLAREPKLSGWRALRSERIASGFYTSQALELVRQ